ncbi:acetyltransferase [Ktedonobacter sp. SOSP1-85]|uniref:GNAT family N-acetyltransferase n=1 Tax=Ktedonobacter sp. SOSP1-85 TaxID=2778367 RepID=UPI001916360A|nr:GNAT family protein [Ktedonobacter sp. SOSP1-85]GHO79139.1 acetyltransferase [Ktedonobacter sp. SOSP1-85]
MFTLNSVTLRPLETTDLDTWYTWEYNMELAMLAGWIPLLARTAFKQKFEQRINEPKGEMKYFAIDYESQFVGVLQLAEIDHYEKRAAISIIIGPKELWGRGIGSTALRLLLDYAFTVQGLERVYSEVYGFNTRSQRLMERTGFQKEGILRQHTLQNGKRQDLHLYGILKSEFYERYPTIFTLPE